MEKLTIDDGDEFYAEFHPQETTKANMKVIKEYIQKRGIFMALYTDKDTAYNYKARWTSLQCVERA